MKQLIIFYSLIFMGMGISAQTNPLPESKKQTAPSDSLKTKTNKTRQLLKKMIQAPDTLTMSDYTLSIERVNDHLIAIGDSAKLGFEVVKIGRRIGTMTEDVRLIRQNVRGRQQVFNLKNQSLYQSYTARLDNETDMIQAQLDDLYKRVYHAKIHLKTVLSDSIFRKLYADKELRTTFDEKLILLEKKWHRTDSITKANVDTLNALKVRLSDNSYILSNMLNILDNRMDRAAPKLFGPEVNRLWEKENPQPEARESAKNTISIFDSEQKAIGYYISQTSGERNLVIALGILLFGWLFFKRNLLKTIRKQKESYNYLHLQYVNNNPALSLLIVLLSLMPFFDAYAPTSYISIVYVLLLIASTVIFIHNREGLNDGEIKHSGSGSPAVATVTAPKNLVNWVALAVLFVVDAFCYLLIEPGFAERVLLLAVHSGILLFSIRFYRSIPHVGDQMQFGRLLKTASVAGILLSFLAIICNLFGRFSLSGFIGIAAIFAVTQAVVLTLFIGIVVEIVLLQLLSSRLKKGIEKPFDTSMVIKKVKMPLMLVTGLIWLIMLTSNLNIYHSISTTITEALTTTRTIGSISFEWLSVLLFFFIIWFAHVLQRWLSYFFGETGTEAEDITTMTKGQHSRLLITRLLVLMAGYLLAIAASGLPIDKLTFLLGALGVGIGMGLQNIVNNIVSGIILIFEGSLQIGDEIEASGQAGKVKEIGLRSSTLTTADGADVIIPNGNILSQNIVNWTFSNNEKRIVLSFSLTGSELDANVINEVINSTIKNIQEVSAKRKPVILFTKVTPESCTLTVRFWSTQVNIDPIKSDAMVKLSAAFAVKKIGFE